MFEDIFGLPRQCRGIGDIYPILLKDYALFSNYSWILRYDKRHTYTTSDDVTTLEAILFKNFNCDILEGLSGNDLVKYKVFTLQGVIEMVTKDVVEYSFQDNCYYIGKEKDKVLGSYNYDDFRQIVMEQNLIHAEKFYKSKLVEQWMKKAKEARARKSDGMNFEDIVTTIKVFTNCKFNEIYEETYYQVMSTFMRISEIKNYDTSVIFASQVGTDKVPIESFAKPLKLLESNDDNLLKNAESVQKML